MGKGYIDPNLTLKEIIRLQRKAYKKFVPVYCRILNREIVFTMDGFEHLHMKRGKKRVGKDARTRLFLLEHAPGAITQSRMIKTDEKTPDEVHSGTRTVYHELYAKVGIHQNTVVVTLRTVGSGNTHFYGIRYAHNKKKTAEAV